MRKPIQGHKLFHLIITFLLLSVLLAYQHAAVSARSTEPPEEASQDRVGIQTGSAGLAWGDADGPHLVYNWPFTVVQMGHVIQSYQDYGGAPYFHHGIDMIAPYGTSVYTYSGGQVVNVENYNSSYPAPYWEVAILDAEGYVRQYHHLAQPSIPTAIYQAYQAWQQDHQNGGFIPAGTKLGEIVEWPVYSFGYYFNHIHLNILADNDVYLNPLEFHTLLADNQPPVILHTGLTLNNTLVSGDTITESQIPNYGLYAHVGDLFLSQVYTLPPYKIAFSLDGAPWETVWEFHTFPGGSDDTLFVEDFFIAPPTCGDYDCRQFYIDLGFSVAGQRQFPSQNGSHTIQVQTWDYNQNSDLDSYTWTVVHPSSVVYTGISAEYTALGNLVHWSTASIGDTLGFNVYRSDTPDGEKTKINLSLIPSAEPKGAAFSFIDEDVELGRSYWYWVDDEDAYGPTGAYYGPASVQSGWQLHLPFVLRGVED